MIKIFEGIDSTMRIFELMISLVVGMCLALIFFPRPGTTEICVFAAKIVTVLALACIGSIFLYCFFGLLKHFSKHTSQNVKQIENQKETKE